MFTMTQAQMFYFNLFVFMVLVVVFRLLQLAQPAKEVIECQSPEKAKLLNLFPKPRFPKFLPKFLFVKPIIKPVLQPITMPVALAYAASTTTTTFQPVSASDTSFYKTYIYQHESGNDPTRWNTSGCVGLGQACPASKLLAVCPNLDYQCEDQWFTDYANKTYNGWENAYYHWLVNHNW